MMKRAIVIGASSGIGKEVAQNLINEGWTVGLAARRDGLMLSMMHATPDRVKVAKIDVNASNAADELNKSAHFTAPISIYTIAGYAKPIVDLGNQTGEGWFLTGEMIELIHHGVNNIVCTQPFGCLPNHVVGKGVIKEIRHHFPGANIVAIDYDPGASEVNQLNRIKLMLSSAVKALNKKEPA